MNAVVLAEARGPAGPCKLGFVHHSAMLPTTLEFTCLAQSNHPSPHQRHPAGTLPSCSPCSVRYLLTVPPSPPSLPTGHQRRFYWKHRGTRPCHAGMAAARLLSSLSLYWLLLPSDIQPFSFLQAVTAAVVVPTLCQAGTSCVTHRNSPFGFAWSISPSTGWGRQTQTADPGCHSQGNPTTHAVQVCCTYAACGRFGTQWHTALWLSKQTALPHCFVLLSLQQELPQSLQQPERSCPNSPCGTMMGFWGVLVLDRHQLTEVNVPKLH